MFNEHVLGESWIGLDNLHKLTRQRSYSLRITMTDFEGGRYVAVYDQFQVSHFVFKLLLKIENN